MGQIIVNGDVYGESLGITAITPEYNEGILICTITMLGQDYKIYIPDNSQQQNNGGNE